MDLDFTRNLHYVWALAPEIVLCVWGVVVLLAGVSQLVGAGSAAGSAAGSVAGSEEGGAGGHGPAWDLGWLALAGILLAALANGWLHGVHAVGEEGLVAVDGLRLFSNWIFLVSAAFGILVSFAYVHRQRLQAGEFYSLILFATAGMMFMAGAQDLIVIFLGLEVMSIAIYALAAFNRRDRRSAEAGLKYFLLGAFSTGFFLYGIALVYGAAGSTHLAVIADAVQDGSARGVLLLFGVGLLAVGFAFKVSAVPFHMWTPDVYEGAPTPVTAFMSAAVKAAAFVAFARVFFTAFDAAYESWYAILWWVAAATMVVGNLVALVQDNVKRLLAYSSIAHAGYLLVAITAANRTAAAGMLFYLLVYAVMNIGAFAVVLAVSRQGEENLAIDDYAGLGHRSPALALVLTVFLLSLAGFPGTGGFMGKIYLLQGAVEAELWTLSVILVLTTVLSYYYYLRIGWFMWMRDAKPRDSAPLFVPMPTRLALLAGTGVVLYLGVLPSGLLDLAMSSVTGEGLGFGLFGGTP